MNGFQNTFSLTLVIFTAFVLCTDRKQTEPESPSGELTEGLTPIKPDDQESAKALSNLTVSAMGNFNSPSPEALREDTTDEPSNSCPSGVVCSKLGGECIDCQMNMTCVYGADIVVTCQAKRSIVCVGKREFQRSMNCRYCYQTPRWQHTCKGSPHCRVVSAPREKYVANCTVNSDVVCLGNRKFLKQVFCNWTAGYRWTTTLVLSITLGGFGADRFYLGHWQEGIGKLFSFGGLGVWTLIDVILIAIGYLGPADGSLYIW